MLIADWFLYFIRSPRLLSAAALLSLVGCSLGPEYKRPDVAVPHDWRESAASADVRWPSTDWWHAFGSAELDGYVADAKRANYDLAAAIARVREADAQAKVAGAALLPTMGASFDAVKEREQTTTSSYVDFRQESPQLSVSYMIDFWGKNRETQNAALAIAAASRYDQTTVELTVITGVAQSYFQCLALRDRLRIAQGNLASAETTLKGLRLQLKAGIATALDVAQQETVVASLSAAIPPLQQQFRQTVHALAILTGKPPGSVEIGGLSLVDLAMPAVQPGMPADLLVRRPDVAEAEAQLVSANANIAVARASFLPSIQLTASDGYASSALSTLIRSSSGVYSVSAGIAQPIFDGGVLRGQYAYAQARYDELVANYRKTVLSAFGNVEDALVAMQQTEEQTRRLGVSVEKAERAHRIAQAQLHSGVVTILNVLNTESALFTAQDALIQARYSHMQALVSLFAALGGGWQKESGA